MDTTKHVVQHNSANVNRLQNLHIKKTATTAVFLLQKPKLVDVAGYKGSKEPKIKQIIKYQQPYIELWFEMVNLTRQ